jgi:threonine/homoserine/homoserine lactone efflux protein
MLKIFISSFVIALSGALMPGPLLTATIAGSAQHGFITGPLIITGHAILELVLITALLLGLAPYFQLPMFFVITAFSGSIILVWMAHGMIRTLPSISLALHINERRSNNPVLSGILMSIANPYWIIWWATIGLGYIIYSQQFGILGIAFFFMGHILADFAWYTFISTAVAAGKHLLTDRLYRGLVAVCAVFLIVFAFYFAYAGYLKLEYL